MRVAVFMPDGATLLLDGPDLRPRLHDVRSGRLLAAAPDAEPPAGGLFSAFVLDPAGRRLAASGKDGRITVWSVPALERIATFGEHGVGAAPGHSGDVRCLDWSRDGRLLASGGDDSRVGLWDVERRECRAFFRAQEFALTSVGFSPDETRLLTTGHDGASHLWDLATLERWLTLQSRDEVLWSGCFSADGREVVAVGADGTVRRAPVEPLEVARARKPRELTAEERRLHELEPAANGAR